VGNRYNVIRVYPLFWWTESKTIKVFGLRKNFDLGTPCSAYSESKRP